MADSGGGGPSRGRGNWRGGNNRWKRGNYRGRENFRGGRGCAAPVSRPNQRITDSYSPVPCPYKGWKHYFPTQDFTPTCRVIQHLEWITEYFNRLLDEDVINQVQIVETQSFPLDYQHLVEDETLKEVWPQLSEDIYNSPESTLSTFSLAMHQLLLDDQQENSGGDDSIPTFVPYVRARLGNYKTTTPLKNLRASLYGKLVAICGTVVRVSNTKPLCLFMAFKCRTCSGVLTHPQPDGKFEEPTRCTLEREEGLQCTGFQFDPMLGSNKNVIVEWQTIRIQENSADNMEVGRIPRNVDCELMEDLVDSCSPGEIVTLLGILKVVSVESDRRSKEKNMFTHYIEAVAVQNQDRGGRKESADEMDQDYSADTSQANSTTGSRKGLLTFNLKDLHAVNKIHEEPNLFAFLVASLCPSIFGHELVKAGMLLSLFSGTKYDAMKENGAAAHQRFNFTKRPDIHVLTVGDPGLGKSQMLQACCRVAPRGVYVCGNSTTSSGLTVTLTKDGSGNGNEYTLEAGALVLADQGTCCIDEFDKMGGQHQALLEAMEQQSISLAKAGVVCSLPARTSILAAANPVGGHYDRSKTVSENIKLGPALLSRFDLVFLLLDRPDLEVDTMLTEHIMALHAGSSNSNSKASTSTWKSNSQLGSQLTQLEGSTLKSRLRLPNENPDLLPSQLLRKYIAYAREYVHPVLDREAMEEIQEFYLELRSNQYAQDSTPVTPRQLESLVRLSQARAKAELREVVVRQDALDVIELVRTSFDQVFKDEFGELDFTRSLNGSGMSQRNEKKKFIEALQIVSKAESTKVFTLEELKKVADKIKVAQNKNFSQFLDSLNQQNYLLFLAGNKYKLLVD